MGTDMETEEFAEDAALRLLGALLSRGLIDRATYDERVERVQDAVCPTGVEVALSGLPSL